MRRCYHNNRAALLREDDGKPAQWPPVGETPQECWGQDSCAAKTIVGLLFRGCACSRYAPTSRSTISSKSSATKTSSPGALSWRGWYSYSFFSSCTDGRCWYAAKSAAISWAVAGGTPSRLRRWRDEGRGRVARAGLRNTMLTVDAGLSMVHLGDSSTGRMRQRRLPGLRWERDSAGRGCARTRRPGRDDASCGTVLVAAHCGRCVAGCTAKREPHEHGLVLGAKRAAGAAVLPPATAIRIASGTTKPGREIVRTEGGPLVSNWAEREERGVAKHMQADETDAKNRTADRRVPASKAPLPLAGGHARQNCSTRSLPVGDGPRWRTHAVGESEDYGTPPGGTLLCPPQKRGAENRREWANPWQGQGTGRRVRAAREEGEGLPLTTRRGDPQGIRNGSIYLYCLGGCKMYTTLSPSCPAHSASGRPEPSHIRCRAAVGGETPGPGGTVRGRPVRSRRA